MKQHLVKSLYITIGSLALMSGIIGIFLPILPTTPFLLLATFCFSRSNERLHNWILNHRIFGPPIRDWQTYRVISPRAKLVASLSIFLGLASVYVNFPERFWLGKYATMLIMVIAVTFILLQKSRRDPE